MSVELKTDTVVGGFGPSKKPEEGIVNHGRRKLLPDSNRLYRTLRSHYVRPEEPEECLQNKGYKQF